MKADLLKNLWAWGNTPNAGSFTHVTLHPDAPIPIFKDSIQWQKGISVGKEKAHVGFFKAQVWWFSLVHTRLGFQFIRITSQNENNIWITKQKKKKTKSTTTHTQKLLRCTEASPDFAHAGRKSFFHPGVEIPNTSAAWSKHKMLGNRLGGGWASCSSCSWKLLFFEWMA